MSNISIRTLLVAILMLSTEIHLCGGSPRPDWKWPDQEAQETPRKKSFLDSGNEKEKLPADLLQPRAYFTFGSFTTLPATQPTQTTVAGNCKCVPFYFCNEGQVVSDGNGITRSHQDWPCRSVLEVCCKNPQGSPTPSTGLTTPPSGGGGTTVGTVIPGYAPQCGTLNPNGVHARILGIKDTEAQFGEYPWQAAILEQRAIGTQWVLIFVCGAALISQSVVITAAHCVKGKDLRHLVIRLGEWDTQTTNEFLPFQDIWISEILIHPQYYSGALHNDIALVFLQTPAMLSPHIDTICLPTQSPQASYDGSSCWATGWGKNAFGPGGQYQAILREVELPVISENICASLLRNTSLGPKFNFHSSYLCAGGIKGRDSCVGDGGGPLVCPSLADPWRYVLAGITSWGVGCGQYAIPGVYTNVSKFTTWIETQVSSRYPTFNPRIELTRSSPTTKPQPLSNDDSDEGEVFYVRQGLSENGSTDGKMESSTVSLSFHIHLTLATSISSVIKYSCI